MAGLDYRDCDVCHERTFYDANLNLTWGVGALLVLCRSCAKTHRLVCLTKTQKLPAKTVAVVEVP